MSRTRRGIAVLGAMLLGVSATVAAAQAGTAGASEAPIVNAQPLFTPDDLLLLEVSSQGVTLSDALGCYSSRAGVFLPLGELTRLLDVQIMVEPPERRAEGWFLSKQRTFLLDLAAHRAEVDGRTVTFSPGEALLVDDEIYVRTDLLDRLLPLNVSVNVSALQLTLTTREPFPFQERLERERRRKSLGAQVATSQALMRVDTPYEPYTPPSMDLSVTLGAASAAPRQTSEYEFRAAGDLAYAGAQFFAGSDAQGRLNQVRALLERRDPDGVAFGLTRAGIGDVYTPPLPVGAASHGGRGFAFSNEPLEQLSVFDHIDLRGELPQGYEVELYVNEVLRSSQSVAVQGLYAFQSVPLAYGVNTVRLVFYGPHGERYEQLRRVNVGGGLLAPGQTVASLGAVEQDVPVFDVRRSPLDPLLSDPGSGRPQLAATFAHGLTSAVTLGAALAEYTPRVGAERRLGDVSLTGAIGGLVARGDAAADDAGGWAGLVSLADRWGPVSLLARHWEYRAGFVDELQPVELGAGLPLLRSDDLHADLIARLPAGLVVPLSLQLHRDQRLDGSSVVTASGQFSSVAGRVLLANGLSFERSAAPGAPAESQFTGNLNATGVLLRAWQVRGELLYDVTPRLKVTSTGFTADRNLSPRTALRLGLQQTLEPDATSTLQGGLTLRLASCDISLNAAYTTRIQQWQALLQVSMGSLFDPLRGRYRVVRPGAASSGALDLRAFVDGNGDGRWEPGEPGQADIAVDTTFGALKSGIDGLLLVPGVGSGARATVPVRQESVDDPYLLLPATGFELKPRPGRVASVEFPLRQTGEVMVRVRVRDAQGRERGVSALAVEIVDAAGRALASGRTEYDGTVIVDGLPPGSYQLQLEPAQSQRLGLRLSAPVAVMIPPAGGYVGEVSAMIVVAH